MIKDTQTRTRVRNFIVKLWNEFVAQATKQPPPKKETEKKSVVGMKGFLTQLILSLSAKRSKSGSSSNKSAAAVKYLMSLEKRTMSDVEIMAALGKIFPAEKLNQLYTDYIRKSGKVKGRNKNSVRNTKEEQYIARQIKNLKSLLHAYSCDRVNCPVKHCVGMRKLWRHWYQCSDTSSCRIRDCKNMRRLASHFYHVCYPKLCTDPTYKCPKGICHVAFRRDELEESLKFGKAQVKKGLEKMVSEAFFKVSSLSSSSSSSSVEKTKSEPEKSLSPDVLNSLVQGMSQFLGRISDVAASQASYRSGDPKTAAIVLDDIKNATHECFPELESLLELNATVRNLKTKRSRYMIYDKESRNTKRNTKRRSIL